MADISKVKLPDNVTYNLKDSGAVRKTGDTMTGALTLYYEGTTNDNHPTELKFQNKNTTTGKTSYGAIRVYDGGESGSNLVIIPNGNMFIGSGEAAQHHYDLYTHSTSEQFYATADSNMYLQANGQTIANRVGIAITTDHALIPVKADVGTNNVGSIGTSSYKWANGYFTNINGVAVGNSPKFTDTNTTYTLGTSGNNVTLTPSSGSAQSITVPYASSTKKLANYYDSRPTDCNLLLGDGSLRTFQATSVMTSNKPPIGDAHIIHLAWDGTNGYDGQIALKNSGAAMMCRAQSSKTWGSWMPIGVFTQATPTTGQVVITDGTVGGIKSSGYTIAKSVPSDAKFTDTNTHRPIQVDGTEVLGNNTTALNLVAGTNVSLSNDGGAVTITATDTNNAVAITNTNPTTGTWYYPVWHSSTSATSTGLRANDGFLYYSIQGTASAVGRSILRLGNGTQTGTAGNKYGDLRIYSQKQGYSTLTMASGATAERKHTLPDVAGTIGVFTATPTSGQVVVSDGTAGGFKTTGYTIAKSVPSNAVFTDTNTKVTTANDTSTNSNFRLLMAATADDTNREDTAKKNECLWFNPSTQTLRVGDNATGDHIINIGGSTVLNGSWGESDGILSIHGKYYEAIHIYQKSSSGADSYIQSHHNLNMGAYNISNGTISSMTYTEGVTHTTGYIMHGRDTSQQYSCQWASSKLNFYVGTTNIGNISDRQLKSEIDEIDPRLMEAIAECKIYQYKAFNRDGLISVGIMAQDLVEKCEEKGIRPENYELLTKMNFIQGDDTLYYSVDYNQYATFMIDYLQKKVKELEARI